MTAGGSQWRRNTGGTSASRGRPRTPRRPVSTSNEIYDDLLDEALQQVSQDESRPLKKRKSQRDASQVIMVDDVSSGVEEIIPKNGRDVVIVGSSESEEQQSDDEDEMDWDDVDLAALPISEGAEGTVPVVREVTLTTTPQKSTKKRSTAIPRTAVLKKIRMEAHKMHLLSLLASFRHLNRLLSSPSVLKILRPLIPPATVNALNTGPEHTQARRTIAFLSGLRDLVSLWSEQWKETKKGWRRPRWVDTEDLGKIPAYLDMNESISLDGLIQAATSRSGSRDVGAWLFTALLRSVGIEARLVCSLQPLQFGFSNEGPRQEFYPEIQPPTEQSVTEMTRENSHISISSTDTPSEPAASRNSSKRKPAFPSSSLRQTGTYTTPAEYLAQNKTFSPNHPFFWSEAWDVASQKWITVEAMVGARVNQPSRIEPPGTGATWEPSSMGDNILSYAIALDNNGFAKDVTKRYSKAYYSKTWRSRIESQGGEKWWNRLMKYLDRMEPLDRDQLEDIDLANHLLKEPVPKKIDDFRHHPLYVLERHLRRNEMLIPGAVHVSALTSGKGMNLKTEHVYKRKDVVSCFTAREWFRRGRVIKEGQQPVKYTSTSNRKRAISEEGVEEGDTDSQTPLYSETQTEIYVPPPVENGVVPKNTYGNIDVYTPSMVPAGGAHIVRPSISLAAQFAGIDYADAVTGYDFVKNKASARVNGIVVASENVEGLLTVWEGMMERVEDEEERRRVICVLERWRRFFVKLGIRRRLDETHGKVDRSDEIMPDEEREEQEDGGDLSGGFLLGAVQDGQDFARESDTQAMRSFEYAPYDRGGDFTAREPATPAEHMSQSRSVGVSATKTPTPQSSIDIEQAIEVPPIGTFLDLDEEDAPKDVEKMGGVEFVEGESDGGGFLPETDNDSEGGGFIYEDEDGIL